MKAGFSDVGKPSQDRVDGTGIIEEICIPAYGNVCELSVKPPLTASRFHFTGELPITKHMKVHVDGEY